MFYHLLYPLRYYWSVLNVFKYITFRAAYATITALFISFFLAPAFIKIFRQFQVGESIREDGPAHHANKRGTPTMGGLIIITATVLPTLLWADITNSYVIITTIAMMFLGMIGFMDDYLKLISPKNKKGLIARYKLIAQGILGVLIGSYLYLNPLNSAYATKIALPFFKNIYIL